MTPGTTATPEASADAASIMARCDELATFTSMRGGIERVYLSPEHRAVNDLAARWMREAGMQTWQDEAGNQCGRVEGRTPGLPALVLASHLDSVPDAGRYDGILGVVTAISAVQRLVASGAAAELPFALEVIAFGDEEGTRFGATLLGSRAVAGTWDERWWTLTDARGVTLRQAFLDFGLDPSRVGDAARRPETLAGYLEVHIEQGPRLEEAGRALGIVSGIAAARRFALRMTGESRHCATPVDRRHDALMGTAELLLAIERLTRDAGTPATVGRIEAHPGAVNVIPGSADFSLDLRAESEALRETSWAAIVEAAERIAAERGLTFSHETTHAAPEVRCAPWLQDAVRAGIESTGDLEPMELFSIAGHDAMAVAAATDVAMLFVRCHDGISHHPDEAVTTADVGVALDAFTAAIEAVARR